MREGDVAVTVTEATRAYLAARLEEVADPEACFRLRTDADQRMSTTIAAPSSGDALVRHGDQVVLAIAEELAARLEGSTIDLERGEDGRRALIVL